jgi:hypothetical protein
LYAVFALPEILMLGSFSGSSQAPVSDMLSAAVGQGAAAVAAALAAVIALNNAIAYVASLSELGTALRNAAPSARSARSHVLAVPDHARRSDPPSP